MIVMSLLLAAVARHAVNKYPTTLVVIALLLAANCLILWRIFRSNGISSWQLRVLWILGAVASMNIPSEIAACIIKPGLWSGMQVCVALWWLVYAWGFVRTAQRKQNNTPFSKPQIVIAKS